MARTPSYSSLSQHLAARFVWLSLLLLTSLVLLLFIFRGGKSSLFPGERRVGHEHHSDSVLHLASKSIANATLGFEKILAINLPERSDHRDGLALAAAVSDIAVDFIEGVHADGIPVKALPPGFNKELNQGSIGSWRAHINAIRKVVETGASTALIIEDDVDWDVRLRSSLEQFATASRALHNLPAGEIDFRNLPINQVQASPYGDEWDVLWMGHCGMEVPEGGTTITLKADETVPEAQYLKWYEEEEPSPLTAYPPHTRLFMEQAIGTCSLAYAVSQKGARGILNDLGINHLSGPFDIMLRRWCAGLDNGEGHTCYGVLPQLFDHFRRDGSTESDSDISTSEGLRETAHTLNIRLSVRLNMNRILRGDNEYTDQWPDTGGF